MRNIYSTEKVGLNTLSAEESKESHFVRKKFFRHHKRHNSREQRSGEKKFEIPEHEFEEKFELKPPPKKNVTEFQQFQDMTFRDTDEDLEMVESRIYNDTEVLYTDLIFVVYYKCKAYFFMFDFVIKCYDPNHLRSFSISLQIQHNILQIMSSI